MSKLLGLHGIAGSGKDTAAEALIEDGWVRDAFADRMRKAVLALDPILYFSHDGDVRLSEVVEALGWDDAKRTFSEVRRLLQRFGTEAGRDVHGKDCWVDALLRDWDYETPLVITDVRFDNEAEAIRELGGLVIEIERPGLERLPGNHASEAGLSPELIDFTIVNDGTVEDLHRAIRTAPAAWEASRSSVANV